MKYLVYLLVLANVAYLGWNIHLNQIAGGDVSRLPALPAGVVPLVTLHEQEQQEELKQKREQRQQQEEKISGVEAMTVSQPPGAGAALVCQTLGPFLAVEDLTAVSEKLRLQGVQSRQRAAEIQKANGFWVYLPAMERKQVLQAVKTLEENGDREYYVGKGNYLALGTFKEISRAEIRLEQVRNLGFDPIMESSYQTATEYWLDIDAQTPVADALDAILEDRTGLKLQETACP